MTVNARSRARRLALQALYEGDTAGHDPLEALARAEETEEERPPDAAVLTYARELIERVCADRPGLDRLIQAHAPAFPLDQVPAVDRNILRVALAEILWEMAPPKVAINEAVLLAKGFGGEGSSRFVNGVLGSALAQLQPDHYARTAPPQRR